MNSLILLLILVISSASSHRHHHHPYGGGADDGNTLIHPPWWAPSSNGGNQGRDFGPGWPYPDYNDGSGGQFGPNGGGRRRPWGRPMTTEPPRITYPIYPDPPTERSTTTESLIDLGTPSGRPIDPSIESCKATCLVTNEHNPVCGTDNITYPNIGRLECARSCGADIQLKRHGPCSSTNPTPAPNKGGNNGNSGGESTNELAIATCMRNCRVTSEYNPVCGTNNVTYTNLGRLECARNCGVAVQIRRRTSCSAPAGLADAIEACISTCSVTPVYDPVCGTNNVTYANPGQLECAKNCGLNVEISRKSSCLVPPGPNNPNFRGSTESPNGDGNGSGNGTCSGNGSGSGDGSGSASGDGNEGGRRSGCGSGSDDGNGGGNGIGSGSGDGDESGSANKNLTMTDVLACMQLCPITPEINVLCGTDGVTYGNPGKLLCAQFCGVDVRVQKFAPCLGQPIPSPNVCPTLPTPTEAFTNPPTTQDCIKKCCVSQELKPVCGTNGVTYINIESLLCNSQCGVGVSVLKLTPCGQTSVDSSTAPTPSVWPTPTQPTPTPSFDLNNCINKCTTSQEYKPVCGTDGETYANLPKLQCAKRCGINVDMKTLSPCFISPLINGMKDENSTDTNNQGFTIPPDILASVFPEYFTPSTTSDPDESYEIDIKFGNDNNITTKVL